MEKEVRVKPLAVQSTIRVFIRLVVWVISILFLLGPLAGRTATKLDLAAPAVDFNRGPAIAFIVLLVVTWYVGQTIAGMFYVLPQWQKMVLLRLGKFDSVKGPGVFVVWPFIFSVAHIIDTRILTRDIKVTKTLTMDNVPVDVTAAIEMRVEDPKKAVIDVANYWQSTTRASEEALKSTIGSSDLKPLLSETERVAAKLKQEIDASAVHFGVDVRAVRLTDFGTPPQLIEELAVIARAERAARAKVIQAEAEVGAAEKLAEAARKLTEDPSAITLRQLTALELISKEERGLTIAFPVSALEMGQQIAAAVAGSQRSAKQSRQSPSGGGAR